MRLVNYTDVKLTEGFWKGKQENNKNSTAKAIWNRFSDTGRISAFNFDWTEGMDNKPHIFWESDVAKWIEGASYSIHNDDDSKLKDKIEILVNKIEENQGADGYFNIYFTVVEPDNRFKDRAAHELYCAGHLIEAAIAYHEVTGRNKFLKCMMKYADYIYKVFVEDASADFVTPGHEEIELALIKLYKSTGIKKYLELAQFFIDNRGCKEEWLNDYTLPAYSQSHKPVREQKTAQGHAVRACYLYTAMANMVRETQDEELWDSCKKIYEDIISNKMYITGGLGSTHIGEAFTLPYDLPNETAYTETCASISMVLFSKSMLENENCTVYSDVIEKEFYNAMMSGVSLDGKSFFYENPLAIRMKNHKRNTSTKTQERLPLTVRKEVFDCSCCPPNIYRILASIQGYVYGYEDNVFYVNQFIGSEMNLNEKKIIQKTQYPNNGNIEFSCDNIDEIRIRIPQWCKRFDVDCEYTTENNYICVKNPKAFKVNFEMYPRLISANLNVSNNIGKAAVQCGPIIYCMEGIDNGDNLETICLNRDLGATVTYSNEFGLNLLEVNGFRYSASSDDLYTEYTEQIEAVKVTLIPYSCFANRGETDMLVWLKVR